MAESSPVARQRCLDTWVRLANDPALAPRFQASHLGLLCAPGLIRVGSEIKAMLVLGGHVAGQKVHGLWPGLAPEQLAGPGDLAITTDYRDILGEIILRRLNIPHLAKIFPGYTPVFRQVIRE